jgi:hypothetical protein
MAPAARLNRVMSMKIRHLLALCVAIAAPLCAGPAPAQATQADTYVRLMERLEALEQRVATLESTRMYTGPVRFAHRQPWFTRTSISLDPGQHVRSPQVQTADRFKRS